MSDRVTPRASVIVATYNRADYVRTCLEHLSAQTAPPCEIVVVDASPDRRTEEVAATFPGVRYLRNPLGIGHTATARALGVAATTGEIVAFVDDDAYAEPTWLAELLLPYADERVAGVGGRTDNGRPGEASEGVDEVGLLLDDGSLTGHFASQTGRPVDVQHLIGANMSYRRSALEAIGGIHDHWPGTCFREDTDPGLRLVAAGYRLVYTPAAGVFHVGGTYAKGRRFDVRYSYFGVRNHVVLLHHALGGNDPRTRAYPRTACRAAVGQLRYAAKAAGDPARSPYRKARGVANGVTRAGAILAGLVVGRLAARGVEASSGHGARPSAARAPHA